VKKATEQLLNFSKQINQWSDKTENDGQQKHSSWSNRLHLFLYKNNFIRTRGSFLLKI